MPIELELDQMINPESGDVITIPGVTTPVYGVFVCGEHVLDQDGAAMMLDKPTLLMQEADAALITDNSTVVTVGGTQYQSYDRSKPMCGVVTLYLTRDF